MHEIEREILNITKYKVQRKFSDRQDYLKSIFNSVQKLSNDDFDELSDDAAIWANACVEAYNRDRDGDLPDFDEIGDPDEDEDDGTSDDENDDENEISDETESEDGPTSESDAETDSDPEGTEQDLEASGSEDEDEPEPVKPKKGAPKKAIKPAKAEPKKAKPKLQEQAEDEDVVLDKWGCMEGSKNSQALALFEKGATTREVKEKIGGTYYNILKRVVTHGHKLEKKGSVIKLIHMLEKPSKVSAPKGKSKK